jgi:hypothetical protein
MDDLIKLVSKKTGLSETLSRTTVNLVLDYLKKKLPAPVSAQIDLFLKNEGKVAATADLVEGLFGAAKKAPAKKTPAKKAAAKKSRKK